MEIQLNVTISAPELVAALNNIAGALVSRAQTVEPEPEKEAPRGHRRKAAAKPEPTTEPTPEEPKEEPAAKPEPVPVPDEPVPEKSEEDLRTEAKKILTEKAREGKNKEVKALVTEAGAVKLSEIPLDKLESVIEKAKAL